MVTQRVASARRLDLKRTPAEHTYNTNPRLHKRLNCKNKKIQDQYKDTILWLMNTVLGSFRSYGGVVHVTSDELLHGVHHIIILWIICVCFQYDFSYILIPSGQAKMIISH